MPTKREYLENKLMNFNSKEPDASEAVKEALLDKWSKQYDNSGEVNVSPKSVLPSVSGEVELTGETRLQPSSTGGVIKPTPESAFDIAKGLASDVGSTVGNAAIKTLSQINRPYAAMSGMAEEMSKQIAGESEPPQGNFLQRLWGQVKKPFAAAGAGFVSNDKGLTDILKPLASDRPLGENGNWIQDVATKEGLEILRPLIDAAGSTGLPMPSSLKKVEDATQLLDPMNYLKFGALTKAGIEAEQVGKLAPNLSQQLSKGQRNLIGIRDSAPVGLGVSHPTIEDQTLSARYPLLDDGYQIKDEGDIYPYNAPPKENEFKKSVIEKISDTKVTDRTPSEFSREINFRGLPTSIAKTLAAVTGKIGEYIVPTSLKEPILGVLDIAAKVSSKFYNNASEYADEIGRSINKAVYNRTGEQYSDEILEAIKDYGREIAYKRFLVSNKLVDVPSMPLTTMEFEQNFDRIPSRYAKLYELNHGKVYDADGNLVDMAQKYVNDRNVNKEDYFNEIELWIRNQAEPQLQEKILRIIKNPQADVAKELLSKPDKGYRELRKTDIGSPASYKSFFLKSLESERANALHPFYDYKAITPEYIISKSTGDGLSENTVNKYNDMSMIYKTLEDIRYNSLSKEEALAKINNSLSSKDEYMTKVMDEVRNVVSNGTSRDLGTLQDKLSWVTYQNFQSALYLHNAGYKPTDASVESLSYANDLIHELFNHKHHKLSESPEENIFKGYEEIKKEISELSDLPTGVRNNFLAKARILNKSKSVKKMNSVIGNVIEDIGHAPQENDATRSMLYQYEKLPHRIQMRSDILNELEKATRPSSPTGVAKTWKDLTGAWKKAATVGIGIPRFGFTVRNVISELLKSAQGEVGADLSDIKKAWDDLNMISTEGIIKGDPKIADSLANILPAMRNGVVDSGWVAEDLLQGQKIGKLKLNFGDHLLQKPARGETKPMSAVGAETVEKLDNYTRTPAEVSADLARMSENVMRLANYNAFIKKGYGIKEAAKKAREISFDYSDISNEIEGIKSIVPFITFYSKNVPFQVQKTLENPRTTKNILEIDRGTEEMSDDTKRKQKYINIGGKKIPVASYLPTNQLPVDASDSVSDVAQFLVSSLHPFIKDPVEQTLEVPSDFKGGGYSTFTGRALERYPGEPSRVMPDTMTRKQEALVRSLLPPVADVLGLVRAKQDTSKKPTEMTKAGLTENPIVDKLIQMITGVRSDYIYPDLPEGKQIMNDVERYRKLMRQDAKAGNTASIKAIMKRIQEISNSK